MTHTRSDQLFAEALKYMPGGVDAPVGAFRAVCGQPFFVNKAKGARVWDVDGNEYLDYVGTWGPAILGHAHPKIIAAVQQAAENGTSFGIPNPFEVTMAKLICSLVPSVQKVRMCNSGIYLPRPGYLEFLRQITKEDGALLIFDEVMTGFRLAKGGAQERFGITPDLSCFGKVIGGGLPVGAFGGRAEIMDCLAPLGPVYQAGTPSGNPLAMAAGIPAPEGLAASRPPPKL